MGPKAREKRAPRRSHTLGGCGNCRQRHVKCDQVKPGCLARRAVKRRCDGYGSNGGVRWMDQSCQDHSTTDTATEVRRHLYTEDTRASMSSALAAQIGSNAIDVSLIELDDQSKYLDDSGNDNISVGPFGVLNLQFRKNAQQDEQKPDKESAHEDTDLPEEQLELTSSFDPFMSLDYSLQWADLFELDFDSSFGISYGQDSMPFDFDVFHPGSYDQTMGSRFVANTTPPTGASSPDVLAEAQVLLKHFQNSLIPAMGALPFGRKSPWKIMNLAGAVQTLANLTYLEKDVRHANLANLFGILACSAYQLATNPSSPSAATRDRWSDIVKAASANANSHMQKSLQTELRGLEKAKYKEQLMALLTMIALAIISGNQKDARYFTLDAERLLRLRGLAKRDISRKSRLLHHMYTWIRIVGESTYCLHNYEDHVNLGNHFHSRTPPNRECERQQPGHNARLDDFLRLESQGDDVDIDSQKEPDVGLVDIHLDDPRRFSATMYLQIYGLSETWLSLVSQITRLANVMDTWRILGKEAPMWLQKSLRKRADRLEDMVCSFAFKDDGAPPSSPTHHMIRALNSALVIFFYRRIRDVNSWILQSHVDEVISALRDFDLALLQHGICGPGTPWPAFIAGCEALTQTKRNLFTSWTEAAYSRTCLYSYKAATELMREVWRRRDEATRYPGNASSNSSIPSKASWTWIAVSREKNIWAMLC